MKKLLNTWELIVYGFDCMLHAIYFRMNYDDMLDRIDFFEQINSGWYCMYIWPYDDWYNPYPSPERKLRLNAK